VLKVETFLLVRFTQRSSTVMFIAHEACARGMCRVPKILGAHKVFEFCSLNARSTTSNKNTHECRGSRAANVAMPFIWVVQDVAQELRRLSVVDLSVSGACIWCKYAMRRPPQGSPILGILSNHELYETNGNYDTHACKHQILALWITDWVRMQVASDHAPLPVIRSAMKFCIDEDVQFGRKAQVARYADSPLGDRPSLHFVWGCVKGVFLHNVANNDIPVH